VNFDKLLRALIGVTLFQAAYMAEVVRGGLQAIPKGSWKPPPRWAWATGNPWADRAAASPETGDPRHRQHLHRLCSRIPRWC
jgi:hypothetical protein